MIGAWELPSFTKNEEEGKSGGSSLTAESTSPYNHKSITHPIALIPAPKIVLYSQVIVSHQIQHSYSNCLLSDNKLMIYYQNVRGLKVHLNTFYDNVALAQYDIIVITES